jgi:hypothetical protein
VTERRIFQKNNYSKPITRATKPITFIVENHSVYRSTEVRDFVKSMQGRRPLFLFTSILSPEFIPDEHV